MSSVEFVPINKKLYAYKMAKLEAENLALKKKLRAYEKTFKNFYCKYSFPYESNVHLSPRTLNIDDITTSVFENVVPNKPTEINKKNIHSFLNFF